MAQSIPVQHLPEETKKISLCLRDLYRENCEGMELDQESSRGKQIPAKDWLLKQDNLHISIFSQTYQ